LLDFLVQEYTFESIFPSNKFPEETWSKSYLGQDPYPGTDPDVVKSPIRLKIVRICNTAVDYMALAKVSINPRVNY
jgi:hypothetical protein